MSTPISPKVGVFDLETTGVDTAADRIVTAYVGTIDADGNVLSGHEWMIRPDGYIIPSTASAIHGITTERAAADGRPFAEVIPEILDALNAIAALDIPVVAYNASYDFTLFAHELHRYGIADPVSIIDRIQIVDPYVIDKHLDRYRRGSRTLTTTAPVYGVALSDDDAHGAAADATAGGRIAIKQLAAPAIASADPDTLRRLQTGWARAQRASLRDYKHRNGEKDFTIDLEWPLYPSALALRAPAEVFTF